MKIIFLFLDGVGLGDEYPLINPLFCSNLPNLRALFQNSLPSKKRSNLTSKIAALVPVDTRLDVDGLPQSGTGQVTLFTGVNGAKEHGGHFGPFPPTTLHHSLRDENIFRQLLQRKKSVVFANTFPHQFFEYVKKGRRRLSATTMACIMTDVPLLTGEHLKRNEGVSADITRERWPELGYSIPKIVPSVAGRHLAEIAGRHDFTLFEYWLPDHAGHKQDHPLAVRVLETFDSFLGGIIESTDLKDTLLVITSDHGNIEDLSTKSHTLNEVPCIAVGALAHQFVKRVKSLTDFTPAIVDFITNEHG